MEPSRTNESVDLFTYSPLDHGVPAIRLLRLLPALAIDGYLECEIFHDTFDASYECLSYRWGHSASLQTVLLNGKHFYVQPNLHDFLSLKRQRMAPEEKTSFAVWIDAICINQRDNSEKTQQVAQMDKIFRNARKVNVWLGDNCNLTLLYASYETQLTEITETANLRRTSIYGSGTTVSPLLAHVFDTFLGPRQINADPEITASWEAKRKMIEKGLILDEYWNRAWVTQELCLARSAVLVLVHENDILLKNFMLMVRRCIVPIADSPLCKLATYMTRYLTTDNHHEGGSIQRGVASRWPRSSFFSLLHLFLGKQCTIPRDRMFSIIALCKEFQKIKVDYALPDDELVCDIAALYQESISVCSITTMIRSLLPQYRPLGEGYVEVDIKDLLPFWGPFQVLEESLPAISYPCRAISGSLTFDNGHEIEISRCRSWDLICDSLPRLFYLVGSRADIQGTGDLLGYENMDSMIVPGDFIPYSGRLHNYPEAPNRWRMCTEGIKIWGKNPEKNVWTMRISLQIIWDIVRTTEQINLCCYGRQSIRLGRGM